MARTVYSSITAITSTGRRIATTDRVRSSTTGAPLARRLADAVGPTGATLSGERYVSVEAYDRAAGSTIVLPLA